MNASRKTDISNATVSVIHFIYHKKRQDFILSLTLEFHFLLFLSFTMTDVIEAVISMIPIIPTIPMSNHFINYSKL